MERPEIVKEVLEYNTVAIQNIIKKIERGEVSGLQLSRSLSSILADLNMLLEREPEDK